MIGINLDNIDILIKKNNIYLNSFNTNKKRLISTINELSSCYSGNSLEYLFIEISREKQNIETISKVIDNYSNILSSVKCSYESQDYNLKNQVNRINSSLQ